MVTVAPSLAEAGLSLAIVGFAGMTVKLAVLTALFQTKRIHSAGGREPAGRPSRADQRRAVSGGAL
jgi:hypothetical protein